MPTINTQLPEGLIEKALGIEPQEVQEPVQEEVQKEVPVEPEPVNDGGSEETVEEPKAEEPSKEKEDTFDDWSPEETTPAKEEVAYDYTELGKALGFEDVKSKDDLVKKTSEITSKMRELEAKADAPFSGVPDALKEAVEIAKQGGDYESLLRLKQVDYTKFDPIDVFQNSVLRHFTSPDGTTNQEKVDEFLDKYTDDQMAWEGNKLIQQYQQAQEAKMSEIKDQAAQRKEANDKRLREVLDKTEEIKGFQLKPDIKARLYNDISSGRLMQKMFYNDKGDFDYKKIVENAFKAEYFDSITNYLSKKSKNEGKKEIINDLTNADIKKPAAIEKPDVTPKAAHEEVLEMFRTGQNVRMTRS